MPKFEHKFQQSKQIQTYGFLTILLDRSIHMVLYLLFIESWYNILAMLPNIAFIIHTYKNIAFKIKEINISTNTFNKHNFNWNWTFLKQNNHKTYSLYLIIFHVKKITFN